MSNFFESSGSFHWEEMENNGDSESGFEKRREELIAEINEKNKIADEKRREKLEKIAVLAQEDAFWDEMDHWFREHPAAVSLDGFIDDTINGEANIKTKIGDDGINDKKENSDDVNTESADEDDALLSEMNARKRGQ